MMSAARLQRKVRDVPAFPSRPTPIAADGRLSALSRLASIDIETPITANLSGELHAMFDPVSDDALPIYFGPLLGRLYLAGL